MYMGGGLLLLRCIASHGLDDDILQRAIVVIGIYPLDLIDRPPAVKEPAEDGIGAIQVWSSALEHILLLLLIGVLPATSLSLLLEVILGEVLARDDVELTAGGAHLRIDIIGLTCSSHCPTYMDIELGVKLPRQSGLGRVLRELELAIKASGLEVPRLYHEVLDDPMELYPHIGALIDETQEVVPMDRGLVIELYDEGAFARLDKDLRTLLPP
jgi:hypothetical protein